MKIKYDLQKYSSSEYETLIKRVVDQLNRLDFIMSVYQFGGINCPGISDIDFLIVINNLEDCESKKKTIDNLLSSDKQSKYCFFHSPIVITPEDILHLHFFHTAQDLKLLSGKDFGFATIPPSENQCLMWNSYFITSFLNAFRNKSTCSLRYILLLINNIAYTIRNNDILLQTNFYEAFKKKVDGVRDYCLQGDTPKIQKEIEAICALGYENIKIQERARRNRGGKILFSLKKRMVFVPYRHPILIHLFVFTIIAFPADYFIARDVYVKNAVKIMRELNLDKKGFLKMRERFQSISFLNF